MEELKIKRFLIDKQTRIAAELVGEKILGRKKTCDLWVNDELVSGEHLKITNEVSHATVIDLGSFNKTKLNGVILEPHVETELKEGDEVRVGNQIFIFSDSDRLPQDKLFENEENLFVETLLDYSEPIDTNEEPEVDFRFKQFQLKKAEVEGLIERIKAEEEQVLAVHNAKGEVKELDKEICELGSLFPPDSLEGWRQKSLEFQEICRQLETLTQQKNELESKVHQFLRYEKLSERYLKLKQIIKGASATQEIEQKIGELKFMLSQEQKVFRTLQENYERELRKAEVIKKERKKNEVKRQALEHKIEELKNELKKIK